MGKTYRGGKRPEVFRDALEERMDAEREAHDDKLLEALEGHGKEVEGGAAEERGGRGRFEGVEDAIEQLEGISEAQRFHRKAGRSHKIEGEKKSADRTFHSMKEAAREGGLKNEED